MRTLLNHVLLAGILCGLGFAANASPCSSVTQNKTDKYFAKGQALADEKKYQAAISKFTKTIQLDPTRAGAYVCHDSQRSALCDKAGAIQDYEKAIELQPQGAAAYYDLGCEQLTRHSKFAAIQNFDRAIKCEPKYFEAYYQRSIARFDLGWSSGALEDCDKGNPA